MLHSKKLFSALFVISLTACAIPEPGDRPVTKTVDAQLLAEASKDPQVLSAEYDPEIAIAVSKKFQFNVCLKSSESQILIDNKDIVILTTESETKSLSLDEKFCVQWQESVDMTNRNEKNIVLQRKLEIKDKFKSPLELNFIVNPWTDEARIADAEEKTTEQNPVSYELGFESLDLKIAKSPTQQSKDQFDITLSGHPTLNGEMLRYGKIVGQIIINGKSTEAQGVVRDGIIQFNLKNTSLTCPSASAQVEIHLQVVAKRHSVSAFIESHTLNKCPELEGSYSL